MSRINSASTLWSASDCASTYNYLGSVDCAQATPGCGSLRLRAGKATRGDWRNHIWL